MQDAPCGMPLSPSTCMQEKMVKNIIHCIIQVRLQLGSDWYLNLDLFFCCW